MKFLKKHGIHLAVLSILFVICIFLVPETVSAYKAAVKESQLVDGYELIVDGESWFTVSSKEVLLKILDDYKQTYTQSLDSEAKVLDVEFVQNLEIVDVRVDESVFADYNDVFNMVYAIEHEPIYYTVVKGDSVWAISQKHDIPMSIIKQLNPELNPEKIWPGNKIMFEPMNPVLDVMIHLENTVKEPIPYKTEFVKDKSLLANQRVTVKKGVEGEKEVTYDIRLLNGYEHELNVMNEVELSAPVGAVVKVGTKITLMRTGGSGFGVVSGTLSSGYGNRRDPISGKMKFHDGIDIAAPKGTPVYAYADGTVVAAGFNGTRGNYVTIQHPNGLQTNYLHMSKITVTKGQSVKVGAKVGEVGSTGYSTGNHLHFSVSKNGKMVNPWDYI